MHGDQASSIAQNIRVRLIWAGLVLGMLAALLVGFRNLFDWERELADIPALPLATGMVIAGVWFLWLIWPIRSGVRLPAATETSILRRIVVVGLLLRVLMLWSVPALEDDFHRYLWDGAVAANGFNPYGVVPAAATEEGATGVISELAERSGSVHDRINHPHLRTIYPPVAELAFAIAYLAEPWSLLAWRLVCLACEASTLWLLLTLLKEMGRSPLLVMIYWLNPLVIKELMNSAHMEAILVPLVLGTVLLTVRGHLITAAGVLGLAAGTKVWPLMLAPLVLRPLISQPARLAAAVGVLAVVSVLCATPPWLAGFDDTSGFVAYATIWKSNSALFPVLEKFSGSIVSAIGLDAAYAGRLARLAVAAALSTITVAMVMRPISGSEDLIGRVTLLVGALVLLAPAQFPWYLVWVQPFLVLRPVLGLLAATALMPVYYASFYFRAHDIYYIFSDWIVWAIWIPVWLLLLREAWYSRPLSRA